MDIKIFFTTFFAIFAAELADKTQIVGVGMTAKTGKPVPVFLGSGAAYITVTAVSVLIGSLLGKYFKPELVKYIGAVLFIFIGFMTLFDKL